MILRGSEKNIGMSVHICVHTQAVRCCRYSMNSVKQTLFIHYMPSNSIIWKEDLTLGFSAYSLQIKSRKVSHSVECARVSLSKDSCKCVSA